MPIALKEVFFVHRTIEHIRRNLKDAEIIYIITNHRYFRILEQKLVLQTNKNIVLLDEDRLLDGLTFFGCKEYLLEVWRRENNRLVFSTVPEIGLCQDSLCKRLLFVMGCRYNSFSPYPI